MNRSMTGRFLRSLGGRLMLTHMVVACTALLMFSVLLAISVGPLQRELVYRRLADVLQIGRFLERSPDLSERFEPGAPQSTPARAADHPRLGQRIQSLTDLLMEQAAAQNVRILVVDRGAARILFDTSGTLSGAGWNGALPMHPADRHAPPPEFEPPPSPDRGTTVLDQTTWFYRAAPLQTRAGNDLMLVALQQRLSWHAAVGALIGDLSPRLVGLSIALLLLLIWLLSIGMARLLSNSLEPVIAGTRAIADGDLDYRVPETASSLWEVAALAHSFNHMAEQVQHSRQAQRDFVANVGHDLKTPLTSIQGFAQALLDGTAATPAFQTHAAQVIYDETQRLAKLVEEILALARLDSNRFELDTHPIDLNTHLAQLMEAYSARSEVNRVALDWQPASHSLTVQADPDNLERVFTNLLDNAFAHTEAGGRITVRAAQMDSIVEVTITDTGKGIPAADRARIFERFYQVNKSRSGARGSGLGLSIVKEIVEIHGGTVGVESTQGVGSRFWVRLPASN